MGSNSRSGYVKRPLTTEERERRAKLALQLMPAAAILRPTKPEKLHPTTRVVLCAFNLAESFEWWAANIDSDKKASSDDSPAERNFDEVSF